MKYLTLSIIVLILTIICIAAGFYYLEPTKVGMAIISVISTIGFVSSYLLFDTYLNNKS